MAPGRGQRNATPGNQRRRRSGRCRPVKSGVGTQQRGVTSVVVIALLAGVLALATGSASRLPWRSGPSSSGCFDIPHKWEQGHACPGPYASEACRGHACLVPCRFGQSDTGELGREGSVDRSRRAWHRREAPRHALPARREPAPSRQEPLPSGPGEDHANFRSGIESRWYHSRRAGTLRPSGQIRRELSCPKGHRQVARWHCKRRSDSGGGCFTGVYTVGASRFGCDGRG